MTPHIVVATLAALSSLALAIAGLLLGRPGWIRRSFSFGMVMFAVESFATAMLLGGAETPRAHILWLDVLEASRLAAALAWVVFTGALTRHHAAALPPLWRTGLIAGATLALALFGAVVTLGGFRVPFVPGRFELALLTGGGLASVALQLTLTVAVLVGLEACLRTSRGVSRGRIKYLMLGLGGVFLVRFYVLSQVALFRRITAAELNVGTATLLIGNLVLAASLSRARLPESQLAVSRAMVYRSVIVGVLSAYLLAVGGLGWLLTYLQIPENVFWVTLAVFVSTLVLAAVLLSEQARWRVKRFIALNFYRSKYDYREQWIGFTKRLSRHLTLEDLSPELLEAVTEAVGGNAAMLYLADASSRNYHIAASIRLPEPAPVRQSDTPLLAALAVRQEPLVLETDLEWGGIQLAESFPAGSVIVPLGWRGTLMGFMLIGPERTGLPYTPEDIEFMTTMGQQATESIVTARLSEDLARAREFNAFARIASFVVHDLKNLISSLSLLSQNAVKYFDDPEFQKDTILTLSRIVERMQALLARLSSPGEPVFVSGHTIDLSTIVGDAIGTVAVPSGVKLVTELKPVPAVPGDPEALVRVVQNLLTNAVQALGGEGTVEVRVKHEDGEVTLSVTDTGCGMSEEFVRGSLFAPFRTTKPGGWGLGLYQVKEIVERHGGKVTVNSKERSGTTFQVALPTTNASRTQRP
jgi:putative PEP-CTERM system histidine kinase